MTTVLPINPRPYLNDLTGKPVIVKLKWGQEYKGFLISVDIYLNVQLASAQEYIDGEFTGELGEILIRCNNILHIRASDDENEDNEDDEEEGEMKE